MKVEVIAIKRGAPLVQIRVSETGFKEKDNQEFWVDLEDSPIGYQPSMTQIREKMYE